MPFEGLVSELFSGALLRQTVISCIRILLDFNLRSSK